MKWFYLGSLLFIVAMGALNLRAWQKTHRWLELALSLLNFACLSYLILIAIAQQW